MAMGLVSEQSLPFHNKALFVILVSCQIKARIIYSLDLSALKDLNKGTKPSCGISTPFGASFF